MGALILAITILSATSQPTTRATSQPTSRPTSQPAYYREPGKRLYHRPNCRYLNKHATTQPVTTRTAKARKLMPCPRCKPRDLTRKPVVHRWRPKRKPRHQTAKRQRRPRRQLSTPEIQQALVDAIDKTLGKSNRFQGRKLHKNGVTFRADEEELLVVVSWYLSDCIGAGWTRRGAQTDIVNVLKAVHDSPIDYTSVLVQCSFTLADKFGNVTETIVIRAIYYRSTIDRISWPNFLTPNAYTIADYLKTHPEFR